MSEADAVYAFCCAFVVAAALTPLTARLARRVGAVDQPKERGLGAGSTPLLGGLAMVGGVLVASALFLDFGGPTEDRFTGILAGAVVISLIGALDDRFDLPPGAKLVGQIAAASIPVASGVEVTNITLPFIGPVGFASLGGPITVAGLVAIMNVVNLSDGVDGLAAGVCAISAIAFAIIAFDLERNHAAGSCSAASPSRARSRHRPSSRCSSRSWYSPSPSWIRHSSCSSASSTGGPSIAPTPTTSTTA
jgi:UDP-GlcNAc:undecaprenyl-phosphate GlcNAc-1-phosphate transferase